MVELYYSNPNIWYDQQRKKWRGELVWRDEKGKRRFKRVTLKGTGKRAAKAEFELWRASMEDEAKAAKRSAPYEAALSTSLVADYIERYIDLRERMGTIQASTASDYRNSNKHIRRAFSDVAIGDMKACDIENWLADLNCAGYSGSTSSKCYRLLKQVMKDAAAREVIRKNPLETIKSPDRRNKNAGINALDIEARRALLKRLDDLGLSSITVAAYAALYGAIRRGEACGLQWRDVDFREHKIWVRRAIGIGKGGSYVKPPKNGCARDVPMARQLEEVLARWKEDQRKAWAARGKTLEGGFYVMVSPSTWENKDHRWFDPTKLTKGWKTLANLFGIRGVEGRIPTFHDLRHTWATMAVAAGMDIKTIASIMGHTDAAMTLNVYAAPDPAAKREAAKLIEDSVS